ncbi:MAG: hypothetical protein RL120_17605 [Gammaproteobacteria bacterium]
MREASRSVKPFAFVAIIFIALGVTIANETLARVGLEGNYVLQFSAALMFAALLCSHNRSLVVITCLGVAAINMPDATLMSFGIDRDVLLASVCAAILVPSLYKLISG